MHVRVRPLWPREVSRYAVRCGGWGVAGRDMGGSVSVEREEGRSLWEEKVIVLG